ncbi:MAG: hypothetical protein H8D96_15120 [Desulfobacterales bacterium]|uniref:Uncharacterized protein n=1 Tax=Candidatus Desulfatibia vada TaxID=2841696 RepID=A0A8J6P055_9BACT|nr:hypothetical protein [Candidatus Desulfatibia vada]
MSRFAKKIKSSNETGLALIWVLMIVAVTSALSLAFLQKVSIGLSTTGSRSNSIQAQYLAEAAANHALWRQLNEPGFPASESVYYMHDLGNGRYGYKVKKPTATTFAAVATVGAVANQAVNQSYIQYIPSNLMTVYSDTTGTSHPYRRMVGASFDSPNPTFDIGNNTVHWVELVGHPFKNEFVAGFTDQDPDIELGVWDGSSWGNWLKFIDNAELQYHRFDIAYNSSSGDALVLGYDINSPGIVMYTIWDGTAFTNPAQAFDIGSGQKIRFILAEASPVDSEILIAVVGEWWETKLYRWDGATFTQLAILSYSPPSTITWVVSITYERQSGDALIVWADSSASCKYAVWDGSALSSTASLPSFLTAIFNIRAAADPTSDTIFLLGNTENNDIYGAVWDGTSWTDSRLLESSAEQGSDNDYLNFDAAWEESGSEVIAAWGKSAQSNVQYLRWSKGTALSSAIVEVGPDFNSDLRAMRMSPLPGSDRIVMAGNNESMELRYSLWTGDRFLGDPALLLTSNQPTAQHMAFDLAFSDYLPPPPNQAPVVGAGDDQTVGLSTQANLDGTAVDDGLPIPPGAFTTTWSKVSGPGNVTFGDASQVDTTADFSAYGEYVLRLTADDSELTAFDDVTVTVKIGEYVERYEEWQIGVAGSWELKDLSGDPFLVPPNAVVEVAVINAAGGYEWWGGVRAVGSTLERRLLLHEAESGGVDAVVLHVQADANSQIQCYAQITGDITFVLLGFWTDGTYVERWDLFNAVNPGTWEDRSLAPFGVRADQLAEMTIVNKNDYSPLYGGVRTDGSSLNRKLYLQNAESGGVDAAGMMVKAGSTASALIEVWSDWTSEIYFYLAGYWSDPPGTFTEAFTDLGNSTANGWQEKDLSGFGVPAETVLQIALSNEDLSEENKMGVQRQGSSLSRFIDLHEPEDGGGDIAVMHVNADENSVIKWYHEDCSDPHDYHLLGYWDLPEIILEANFDTNEEGFAYLDDAFRGTDASAYASGNYEAAGGFNGGGLRVLLGGINDDDIFGMSGGWQQTFNLVADAEVTISFRYQLTLSSEYEDDEYGQALVSVDGTLYGENPNDYVTQINGNGNGGSPDTSGWRLFTKNIGTLSSGDHTIIIGGYNNKKTLNDEIVEILIDDVIISQ